MSEETHKQPPRTEVLAVLLMFCGLAGLAVSLRGPGLWPSFSGERVYDARLITSEAETPAPQPPAPQYAAAWAVRAPAASDELTLRVINETARSVCHSEARVRRAAERAVETRRQPAQPQQRRQRPQTCPMRPTLLTADASGRPAES